MNNNLNFTGIIIGTIAGLILGVFGGYTAGQKSEASAADAEVASMSAMMRSDGEQMMKMGEMMMGAGTMMEESGTKYKDDVMTMMGKDLGASGMKHEADGKSMMEGSMMGMMDMEGMDHSGM